MSLFDIVRAVRQHLVVVALLLAATGFAAFGVYSQVPVYYQSDASMIVLLPNLERLEDDTLVPVNPWAGLGAQSSQVAASALASIAGSQDFQAGLVAGGVTSEVAVQVAALYGGGVVLTLSAVSQTPTAAEADLAVVSAQLSTALRAKQLDTGAPKDTLLTATELTAATAPAPLATSGIKLAGVTVLIGLVVIAAVVLLLEALRSRPRRPEPTDAGPADAGPGGDGTHQEASTLDEDDDWLDVDLWAQNKPLVSQPS